MIALRIYRAALLASALLPSLAWAGAGTITTKNAAGATITFTTVTDGSTNNLASGVLCDGVAGANCATVKAASTAAAQTDLALVMRNPDLVTGLADAACATDNGTCTIGQLVKRTNQNLSTLNTSVTASIPAGEFHIGEIGSNQIKVQVAQTVTAASAYTSGNAIGGKMTIAGAARVSAALGAAGTGGILTGMQMNSKSLQTTQVDVFLFDADPSGSTCTDKTAFVLATADFDKVVGILTIPGTAANGAGWFGGGTGSVGIPSYLPVTYDLSSATSLFACAVTRGTPTFTATTDVSFKYNFLRN